MRVKALDCGGRGVVRSVTHDGAVEGCKGDLISDMVSEGEVEMLLRIANADVEVYIDNWKHNAHDVKSWHWTCCRVHPIASTSTFTSTRSRLHHRLHLLRSLDTFEDSVESSLVILFLKSCV